MNIIERYDRQFQYAEIIFYLLIAVQFYLAWSLPQVDNASRVIELATLMAFEFIMVHSGFAMAIVPRKYSLYVLFPVYGLFALVFSATIDGHLILITYLITIFNRMRFAFTNVPFAKKIKYGIMSVLAAGLYFFIIMFITAIETKIPVLGLTPKYLEQSNYFELLGSSGGMFLELPQTALCFGLCYYLSLALLTGVFKNHTFEYFGKKLRNFIP